MVSTTTSLVVLLAALGVALWQRGGCCDDDGDVWCARPELHASLHIDPACFYSHTYAEARARFLEQVHAAGLEHTALPVDADARLFVDVAVRAGDDARVLLHVSGVHGTEGYVGSAVQTALLAHRNETGLERHTRPTVVLVHALNPFGMANWRRWNEDGVDLNRNALFTEREWRDVLARDDNAYGYADIDPFINPDGAPTLATLVAGVVPMVSRFLFRFVETKRALVAATYSRAGGLFYGGRSLSRSHTLLSTFLRERGLTESARRVMLIDVHSGIGPEGEDTLMVDGDADAARRAHAIYDAADARAPRAHAVEGMQGDGDKSNDAATAVGGYDATVGTTGSYLELFVHADARRSLSVTQEFGTLSSFMVILNMVRENQAFRFTPLHSHTRRRFARLVYDTFVPLHRHTRANTVRRGVIAFEQALAELAKD